MSSARLTYPESIRTVPPRPLSSTLFDESQSRMKTWTCGGSNAYGGSPRISPPTQLLANTTNPYLGSATLDMCPSFQTHRNAPPASVDSFIRTIGHPHRLSPCSSASRLYFCRLGG
jgi:hypothetical protein